MGVKIIKSDLDGVVADFRANGLPEREDVEPFKEELKKVREAYAPLEREGIVLAVCTGRSLRLSKSIIREIGANGPCAVEMGCGYYFPSSDKVISISELRPEYKESQDSLRRWYNDLEIMGDHFLRKALGIKNASHLKDKAYMVTIEATGFDGEELYKRLQPLIPKYVSRQLGKGIRALVSKERGVVDFMPDVNKGVGVSVMAQLTGIDLSNAVSIGDYHAADIEMMEATGYAACPANSDYRMKNYVSRRNGTGYVSMHKLADGTVDIFRHIREEWLR